MKIEVCEQLAASWLKHEQGCQIIQTNWSASPLWSSGTSVYPPMISDDDIAELSDFINEVKEIVKNDNLDIFKKSTVRQFVSQCEIDVVGIRIADAIVEKMYLVDTAFHKNGVGYSEPVATILKKLLRAIMISDLIFKKIPADIIFAAPKCRESDKREIFSELAKLKSVVEKYYPDCTVKVLVDEDFATEIYAPSVAHAKSVSDDNDLFLRSIQLAEVANSFMPKTSAPTSAPAAPAASVSAKTSKGGNKTKVFDILNDLKAKGKLTAALLADLCNPVYAKIHFDMSTFPVLISVADYKASGFEKCRFYGDLFNLGGTDYLVCNLWIPEKMRKLEAWYKAI